MTTKRGVLFLSFYVWTNPWDRERVKAVFFQETSCPNPLSISSVNKFFLFPLSFPLSRSISPCLKIPETKQKLEFLFLSPTSFGWLDPMQRERWNIEMPLHFFKNLKMPPRPPTTFSHPLSIKSPHATRCDSAEWTLFKAHRVNEFRQNSRNSIKSGESDFRQKKWTSLSMGLATLLLRINFIWSGLDDCYDWVGSRSRRSCNFVFFF